MVSKRVIFSMNDINYLSSWITLYSLFKGNTGAFQLQGIKQDHTKKCWNFQRQKKKKKSYSNNKSLLVS